MKTSNRILISIVALGSCLAPAFAVTHFVKSDATGMGDGTSWADAFTSVDEALGLAGPGDQVWVAMGIYHSPTSLGFFAGPGVSLYGGFIGNESSLAQRIPGNRTRLMPPGRGQCVLTLNNPTSPHPDSSPVVVEGLHLSFTLTPDHDGGGLAAYGGTVHVRDCYFTDNIAGNGAGAFLSNVHASFTNCTFDNNFCQYGDGGGIEANGAGSLTVDRCIFHDNLARELGGEQGRGGGIFADTGIVLRVRDSVFDDNAAYNIPSQFPATGGGIASLSSDARVERCTFVLNYATVGGAIYSEGSMTIVNCTMESNRAVEPFANLPFDTGRGGAIYAPEGVDITVQHCTIVNNWSKHTSAGLSMDGEVSNTILYHNVSLVEPGDNPEPLEDQQGQGNITYRSCTVQGLATPDSQHPNTISADPRLVLRPTLQSQASLAFPFYVAGDLHLQPTSPCIDAGNNGLIPAGVTTDLEGRVRRFDDPGAPNVGLGSPPHVDMGAFERAPDGPCEALSFSQQPAPVTVCPSGRALFTAPAVGGGPISYQWQREATPGAGNWQGLQDGTTTGLGTVYNTGGPTLILSNFGTVSATSYRVIASNYCTSVTSLPATLTIGGGGGCPADINCSGGLSVQDIFDFLAAYFSGDPRGDFNGVGGITVQDLFVFLAAYFAGC